MLKGEIDNILRLGVELKLNTALGKDFTLDDLFEQGYKAVFLGIGCHEGRPLGIPGEDQEGVMQGVEFLRRHNLDQEIKVGKRVAVIGGGNVALDVAGAARRYGATVTIVYRRSREEMPAHAWEIDQGLCEGIKILYQVAPLEVRAENGKVDNPACASRWTWRSRMPPGAAARFPSPGPNSNCRWTWWSRPSARRRAQRS